jgi:hypothetical protein
MEVGISMPVEPSFNRESPRESLNASVKDWIEDQSTEGRPGSDKETWLKD